MEATAFLSRHPGLTGFSERNALFMTVKELLDNAVDAVTTLKIENRAQGMNPHLESRQPFRDDSLPDVELDLHKLQSGEGVDGVKVICRDAGIGFQNDTFSYMITAFRSGKRSGNNLTGDNLSQNARSQNTNSQNASQSNSQSVSSSSAAATSQVSNSQNNSQHSSSQSTAVTAPSSTIAKNSKKQNSMCGTFGIGLKMVLLHAQKVHRR